MSQRSCTLSDPGVRDVADAVLAGFLPVAARLLWRVLASYGYATTEYPKHESIVLSPCWLDRRSTSGSIFYDPVGTFLPGWICRDCGEETVVTSAGLCGHCILAAENRPPAAYVGPRVPFGACFRWQAPVDTYLAIREAFKAGNRRLALLYLWSKTTRYWSDGDLFYPADGSVRMQPGRVIIWQTCSAPRFFSGERADELLRSMQNPPANNLPVLEHVADELYGEIVQMDPCCRLIYDMPDTRSIRLSQWFLPRKVIQYQCRRQRIGFANGPITDLPMMEITKCSK